LYFAGPCIVPLPSIESSTSAQACRPPSNLADCPAALPLLDNQKVARITLHRTRVLLRILHVIPSARIGWASAAASRTSAAENERGSASLSLDDVNVLHIYMAVGPLIIRPANLVGRPPCNSGMVDASSSRATTGNAGA
jgi:hypothetical protein